MLSRFSETKGFALSSAHFTQADTIIPNSGNSGDWDRYAYVLNNPMKYTDPSGHKYYLEGTSYRSTSYYEYILKNYAGVVINKQTENSNESKAYVENKEKGISYESDVRAIFYGVQAVGNMLAQSYQGGSLSAGQAFKAIYGSTEVWLRGELLKDRNGNLLDPPFMGGMADGKRGFTLYAHAANPGLVAHELGHVFQWEYYYGVGNESSGPYTQLGNTTIAINGHITGRNASGNFERTFQGYNGSSPPHVWHDESIGNWNSACEDFADMFFALASDQFSSDAAGKARQSWMSYRMSGWVTEMIGGN